MKPIHYSSAFKSLDRFVKNYNEVHPLKEQIRQAIVFTAQNMIKLYGLSVIKAQSITATSQDKQIPLFTNNVQLGKMGNCSPRTIQRHIKRLCEAGIITHKIWHGSNSSYELLINPKVLGKSVKKGVDNSKLNSKEQENLNTKNQYLTKREETTCLHTDVTSNNSYTTNILIAVDKLNTKMSSFSLTGTQKSRNATSNNFSGYTEEKCPKKSEISYNTGDKKNTGSSKKIDVAPKEAEGNAQKKRVTLQTDGEISSEDVTLSASRKQFSQGLWQYAENILYSDYHLTEYQKERAKEHLLQWYAPFKTEAALLKIHQVYVDRLGLVQKYIAKDKENRYVPLPNTYFDLNNPNGFKGTRSWYFKQKEREKEVQLQLILKRQIRKFEQNEQKPDHQKTSSLEVFRQCETRLGKLGKPELVQAFHAAVMQSQSYKFFH